MTTINAIKLPAFYSVPVLPANVSSGFLAALLLLMGVLLLQLLYQIIYYRFFHELRHVPGPFWASVTRLWTTWHFLRGTQLEAEWNAVKKYGPIVRLTPKMLLLADATAIPTVYHRRDTKSRFYIPSLVKTPFSIVLRHPGEHSAHRRLVSAPYAMTNILRMEPLSTKHIEEFITKLDTCFATPHRKLNFTDWGVYLFSDTISDLAYRSSQGMVAAGRDVGKIMKHVTVGTYAFVVLGSIYPLVEWITSSPLRRFIVLRPEQTNGWGRGMRKADDVLQERRDGLARGVITKAERGDGAYDFLQAFLDARTPEGAPIHPDKIQSEIFTILGAGPEAFQAILSALFTEVLSNPLIRSKLNAEINAALQSGKLTRPVPAYNEVAMHLPYFVACLREAMRLHPPPALPLPREHTAQDPEVVLNGRVIPPGTELACNPWISHRDREVYGDDAEAYVPERWLGDEERARLFERYNLMWGYGARVCLGKHYATMMLYKVPVALFMAFDVALCDVTPATPRASFRPHGPALLWENVWLILRGRRAWDAEGEGEGEVA
ncbi:uncharacterized protein DSM5745_00964 [Aspergillus mulundensis]|uniref:Cytochrome P450 n=1 Tax=Aspergillus mulundensis TaxID=1810919 RepID=A0A3D8T508_9EURO|nr:hypothetical protein DSM5745_00964 [Aspergillus mulundensis]RDW93642.1 hypothetical protein DSM5745_00964 [Aspergillus mulundensis]